ncbi:MULTISPECIES: hypothetical protein [unclassified Aureimonas]|jgi:hypothetical protein|uniref:hypothetical protein n=1 Tax=unclassified Aureimonas TaxID=2615206 RepID=UPI0006FEF01A|nr:MULTISPECIES: hypothetical protein [unclassified Aureimonas]KQT65924.1 hypothetical protein ASG62_20565 [Aureimonas sp. Leaf427]KQT73283.1 hypothetical protein ASG54_17045 [Aureimonas sp. Leaf460]
MRRIEVADELKVRFPARSAEFDDGFEVGMMALLMSRREAEFTRSVSTRIVDQCIELAGKLGYHLGEREESEETVRLTFRSRRSRPKLRLVSSQAVAS